MSWLLRRQSRALTSSRIKYTRISCNFSIVGLIATQAPCPVVSVAQAGTGSEDWHCLHVQSTKAVDTRYVVSSQYSISGCIAHTLYNKSIGDTAEQLGPYEPLTYTNKQSKHPQLPISVHRKPRRLRFVQERWLISFVYQTNLIPPLKSKSTTHHV